MSYRLLGGARTGIRGNSGMTRPSQAFAVCRRSSGGGDEKVLNLLKKAPAAVPGCGNRPEDGPQSRLFSGESVFHVKLLEGYGRDL